MTHFQVTQNSNNSFNQLINTSCSDNQRNDDILNNESQSQTSVSKPSFGTKRTSDQKSESFSSTPKRQKSIPNHWDPEVFEGLPADVKEELLKSENLFEKSEEGIKPTTPITKDQNSTSGPSSPSLKFDQCSNNVDIKINVPKISGYSKVSIIITIL